MGNYKKNCFAYSVSKKIDNNCSATILKCDPDTCPFYKPREKQKDELKTLYGVNTVKQACLKYQYQHPEDKSIEA